MNELTRSLLFFYTETPLHAGSGEGLGAIDLPLQRERMSDLPQVQGSGIKGALRELFRARGDESDERLLEEALFGPRPPDPERQRQPTPTDPQAHEHAGSLAVTDARLCFMPVRSAHGGWAWITSPLILQRLARDLGLIEGAVEPPAWAKITVDSDCALIPSVQAEIAPKGQLIIEDALYDTQQRREVADLAKTLEQVLPDSAVYEPIRARLSRQLAVISDEEMSYWARHGTEVVTRVRIDENTGTVAPGALWTEESLPSESLLWSVVMISDSRQRQERRIQACRATDLDAAFGRELDRHPRIFLGGDRTVGRGIVALRRKEGADAKPK